MADEVRLRMQGKPLHLEIKTGSVLIEKVGEGGVLATVELTIDHDQIAVEVSSRYGYSEPREGGLVVRYYYEQ